jgi:hypothetical protein
MNESTIYGKHAISYIVTILSDNPITDNQAVSMILSGTDGHNVIIRPNELSNEDSFLNQKKVA